MPIHPHHCVPCKRDFEVITLSLNAPIDPTCAKCGKAAERRFGVPRAKTDAFKGDIQGGNQFEGDEEARKTYGAAKRKGLVYQHALARFQGDPEAWVRNKSEAKRLLEKRGWGSEELGVKARDREPETPIPIADDIVDQELFRMVATGEVAPDKVETKRYEVAERLTPPWKKTAYVSPKDRKKKIAKKG